MIVMLLEDDHGWPEYRPHFAPFTSNANVSICVKNSRVGRNTLVSIIMLQVNLLYLAGDRNMPAIVCLMAAEQKYEFNRNIINLVFTCSVMLKETSIK